MNELNYGVDTDQNSTRRYTRTIVLIYSNYARSTTQTTARPIADDRRLAQHTFTVTVACRSRYNDRPTTSRQLSQITAAAAASDAAADVRQHTRCSNRSKLAA
jgi:hypothetical protein